MSSVNQMWYRPAHASAGTNGVGRPAGYREVRGAAAPRTTDGLAKKKVGAAVAGPFSNTCRPSTVPEAEQYRPAAPAGAGPPHCSPQLSYSWPPYIIGHPRDYIPMHYF